eukprot:1103784-Prorocentrum_minimum.AAC.1
MEPALNDSPIIRPLAGLLALASAPSLRLSLRMLTLHGVGVRRPVTPAGMWSLRHLSALTSLTVGCGSPDACTGDATLEAVARATSLEEVTLFDCEDVTAHQVRAR